MGVIGADDAGGTGGSMSGVGRFCAWKAVSGPQNDAL